jgi:hypothetical protein
VRGGSAGRRLLAALSLLFSIALVGCASNSGPGVSATARGQDASSPLAASSAATPPAAAAPTVSTTSMSSGPVADLAASSTTRSQLEAAYAASKGIPVADVAGTVPGSIYYAFDPARNAYWAVASFEPSKTAPLAVQVAFQDGAATGMFAKFGSGGWQAHVAHEPVVCEEVRFFPRQVLAVWSLPISAAAAVC